MLTSNHTQHVAAFLEAISLTNRGSGVMSQAFIECSARRLLSKYRFNGSQ
jgi:hypothetical protein